MFGMLIRGAGFGSTAVDDDIIWRDYIMQLDMHQYLSLFVNSILCISTYVYIRYTVYTLTYCTIHFLIRRCRSALLPVRFRMQKPCWRPELENLLSPMQKGHVTRLRLDLQPHTGVIVEIWWKYCQSLPHMMPPSLVGSLCTLTGGKGIPGMTSWKPSPSVSYISLWGHRRGYGNWISMEA